MQRSARDPGQRTPWVLRSAPRLLAVLSLTLGGTLAILCLALILPIRRALYDDNAARTAGAAATTARAIDARLADLRGFIDGFTKRTDLREAARDRDEDRARSLLRELVNENKAIDRAFVADPDAVEWSDMPSDPDALGRNYSTRDWYQGAKRTNAAYVSSVYERQASPKTRVIAISAPVHDADGRVLAYLVAQHTITSLAGRVLGAESGGGAVLAFDQAGALAFATAGITSAELDRSGVSSTVPTTPFTLEAASVVDHATETLQARVSLPSVGWTVVAERSLAEALAPAAALTRWVLLIAGTCFAGMLVLGFLWLDSVRRRQTAILELEDLRHLMSQMIVHDLRNPLTSVLLSLEMAQIAPSGNAEIRGDLDRASQSANQLRRLIDMLLDVMRMEDGDLRPRLAEHDLAQLLEDRVAAARRYAQSHGLEIAAVTPGGSAPGRVDRDLFERVLDNLISNAIKHTPAGGRVEARLERAPGRTIVAVADTGEGIAAEDVPRLFRKYGRGRRTESGERKGIGLGLLFCRLAVELHGGTIDLETSAGRGTTVRISLPEEIPAAA